MNGHERCLGLNIKREYKSKEECLCYSFAQTGAAQQISSLIFHASFLTQSHLLLPVWQVKFIGKSVRLNSYTTVIPIRHLSPSCMYSCYTALDMSCCWLSEGKVAHKSSRTVPYTFFFRYHLSFPIPSSPSCRPSVAPSVSYTLLAMASLLVPSNLVTLRKPPFYYSCWSTLVFQFSFFFFLQVSLNSHTKDMQSCRSVQPCLGQFPTTWF